MIIEGNENKVTIEGIDKFENRNNVVLSNEYKEFLLEYNGGDVDPSSFYIEEIDNEDAACKFYGINISKYNYCYDLDRNIEGSSYAEYFLHDEFIAIACGGGGNEVCLGIKPDSEYFGKIYYYIHDLGDEDPLENICFLANSFNEFLDLLYEDPDEDNE